MKLHTILGAGGAVGNELFPLLQENNERVRLVSRNAQRFANVEAIATDVTNHEQTMDAVKGSDIVYLLAGLTYDIRVWRKSWPKIMANVIDACKEHGCKLIFFDNVYMYGKVDGEMTEETPFRPISKKGELRASIANKLLNEMMAGNLQALIARSADFYGPVGFGISFANLLVFQNLRNGKKAQWLINSGVPHSFTFVPDAARALYMLANTPDAFGQTWHMPTAPQPLTGEQFIKAAARAMNAPEDFSVISKPAMYMAGLFDRSIKELLEMAYQNQFPYLFNSSKFNKAFNFTPTSYEDGIGATATWALEHRS